MPLWLFGYLLFSLLLAGSACLHASPDEFGIPSDAPFYSLLAWRLGIFISTALFWWFDVIQTLNWIAQGKPDD